MEKEKIKDFGASLDIVNREILVHRRLNHEHIVKLYSSYEDEKAYYLVCIIYYAFLIIIIKIII